jgi:hypothetical protein
MSIETLKTQDRAKVIPGTDRDLDSVSEIDQELLLGERRESDWKDARKAKGQQNRGQSAGSMKPTLEDGAD